MSTDDGSDRGLLAYFGFGTAATEPAEDQLNALKRSRTIRRVLMGIGLVVFGILFQRALSEVGFTIGEIVRYWPEFTAALGQFFPPATYFGIPFIDMGAYWEFIQARNLFQQAIITLSMGFAGTVLGFPGALILGVLGSERVTPFPFNFIFRGIMSTIRAIPALVWALIYIPLGGVTPFTATLAIGTDTMGNLGRLFTDELEEIEDGPIEGIRSTGADGPQTVVFGMLSQVFTPFIAWALYIFEINTRIAVTMGLIGGGGLGYVLLLERQLFHYTNMMATILVILMLVISVEMISQRTRSYLRGGESDSKGFLTLLKEFPQRMAESIWK
ncbi:phosphonate ABC transporter, permease protein PhnE [Halostella salina]|uniref:phosphonate ABC transporter, permease protein PhnE n=1 Tax=Halostella salina TaxID=1547897 RepID=UPI000EF81DC5|nr:phosphonate ABC transporter, permease protein PhnE [Halostella salina]